MSNLDKESVSREMKRNLSAGMRLVSLQEMAAEFEAIGYEFDDSMACNCIAKNMTGPGAGESFPCRTLSPREIDTKISAFNIDARRDDNFKRMQALRNEVFAISKGRIVTV